MRSGLVDESTRCTQCDAPSPEGANFCPECGTPLDVAFLDPFATNVQTHPVTEPTSVRSRFGILAGLMLLAGLLGLLWVLTDDGGESADEVPPDEVEPAESTTPTTTSISSTTSRPTTTTEPEIRYVNDTPGPVLEPGIGGTLISGGGEELIRIDLASGEIESIELSSYLEPIEPGRTPLFGDELVTAFEGELMRTNLITGDQIVLELGLVDVDGWLELIGPAGPGSVWMVSHPVAFEAELVILEVDLEGEILREVELPGGFWVQWAEGDDLYLESPGGTFVYDTTTGVVTETPSRIDFDHRVSMACDESLECTIQMETDAGPVPIPGLDATDVWDGGIRLSPDSDAALIQTWGGPWEDGPLLSYVDLRTGSRVDLGEVEADMWMGTVWIPDTRWVILRSFEGRGLDLIAVNTETAERIDIRSPGLRSGDLWGMPLLLLVDDGA